MAIEGADGHWSEVATLGWALNGRLLRRAPLPVRRRRVVIPQGVLWWLSAPGPGRGRVCHFAPAKSHAVIRMPSVRRAVRDKYWSAGV